MRSALNAQSTHFMFGLYSGRLTPAQEIVKNESRDMAPGAQNRRFAKFLTQAAAAMGKTNAGKMKSDAHTCYLS